MKKLNQFLLGVLFCAFSLNVYAQTEVYYTPSTWSPFEIDCNGVVDIISGTQFCQVIHHYNPNTEVLEWFINRWKAELVSEYTDEVFSVNYFLRGITDGDFSNYPDPPEADFYKTFRYNARGNMGSHYLVTATLFYDFSAGTISIIDNTVKCL